MIRELETVQNLIYTLEGQELEDLAIELYSLSLIANLRRNKNTSTCSSYLALGERSNEE